MPKNIFTRQDIEIELRDVQFYSRDFQIGFWVPQSLLARIRRLQLLERRRYGEPFFLPIQSYNDHNLLGYQHIIDHLEIATLPEDGSQQPMDWKIILPQPMQVNSLKLRNCDENFLSTSLSGAFQWSSMVRLSLINVEIANFVAVLSLQKIRLLSLETFESDYHDEMHEVGACRVCRVEERLTDLLSESHRLSTFVVFSTDMFGFLSSFSESRIRGMREIGLSLLCLMTKRFGRRSHDTNLFALRPIPALMTGVSDLTINITADVCLYCFRSLVIWAAEFRALRRLRVNNHVNERQSIVDHARIIQRSLVSPLCARKKGVPLETITARINLQRPSFGRRDDARAQPVDICFDRLGPHEKTRYVIGEVDSNAF